MNYQQCTGFRTSLDFDREYLWNGSSNRQADNGVINYDFFPRSMTTIWRTLWSTYEKNGLDLWPMTLKLNRIRAVVKVHVRAKYNQAKCSALRVIVLTSFLPYLEMMKNQKIWSCDLDLWPMILKFFGFRAVVKEHVRAKLHRAKCSGSWVILRTGKKTRTLHVRYCADSNNRLWHWDTDLNTSE